MKTKSFSTMHLGWFVGNFEPTMFKTEACEVAYKFHPKGHEHEVHYHAVATEINLLIRGKMKVRGQIIEPMTLFMFEPNDIADPEFLEDCEVVVVKVPSVMNDKHIVTYGDIDI